MSSQIDFYECIQGMAFWPIFRYHVRITSCPVIECGKAKAPVLHNLHSEQCLPIPNCCLLSHMVGTIPYIGGQVYTSGTHVPFLLQDAARQTIDIYIGQRK